MKAKLVTASTIRNKIYEHHKGGGLSKGLSTGWASLDENWLMKKGLMNIFTGVPSSGKSSFLNHLMLNMVALHNWHFTIFSPESWPLEDHFASLAELWTGKPMFRGFGVDPMTKNELDEAIEFLDKALTFIEPPEDDMQLSTVEEALKESKQLWTTDAFVLDPWNELEHSRPSNMTETEYIGRTLTRLRNMGRMLDMSMNIVAHPTKLQKLDNGKWPVPTMYSINGSANWYNKTDTGVSVWRDYDANDGVVDIHIQKIRKKNLGQIGSKSLHWHRASGLFLEEKVEVVKERGYGIKWRVK